MAFYRNSYVPAFTSNDTYGNFYDASKVSLITVPERLKNYDSDVRKAANPTTAAEYGEFMRRDGQYRAPGGYSRLQEQHAELQQARYPHQVAAQQRFPPPGDLGSDSNGYGYQPPPPPQPLPRHLPPLQTSLQLAESPPASPPPSQRQEPDRPDSVRGPPPPASLERYRGGGAAAMPPPDVPIMQRQQLQQQQPPPDHPSTSSPYQYRISRSRSPPPPPDVGLYRSNPDAYTGRARAGVPATPPTPPRSQQQLLSSQPPPPPPQPQPLEPQLPPVRLGQRVVHLPSIEAVEVRMRDNSRVLLDVQDFYRRYLRD